MAYKPLIKSLSYAVVMSAMVVLFQNCSNTEFQNADDSSLTKADGGLEVSDQPVDDGDVAEEPGEETPTEPGEECTDHCPGRPNGKKPEFACRIDEISDIKVNVARIELRAGDAGAVVTAQNLGIVSLTQMLTGLKVRVAQPITATQIRLVLNADGNVLVDSTGRQYALKTPSQQQTGFKLILSGAKSLEADRDYLVKTALDASTQVVRAGKKCLLKPTLKVLDIQ